MITLSVGVLTLLTSVIVLTSSVLAARKSGRKVEEIHVLVNQRLTDVMDRVAQLKEALSEAGVDIPHSDKEP